MLSRDSSPLLQPEPTRVHRNDAINYVRTNFLHSLLLITVNSSPDSVNFSSFYSFKCSVEYVKLDNLKY